MSIHVTRAPTVPLTSYDTKRSSHLKEIVGEAHSEFKLGLNKLIVVVLHNHDIR